MAASSFELGPFRHYERSVTVTPSATVVMRSVRSSTPNWPFRTSAGCSAASSGGPSPASAPKAGAPWWAPPDRLDAEASTTLAALAILSAVIGYATILLSQTITFAAEQFGAGKPAQGVALAAIRFDLLLSFPLVAMTDRRGRGRAADGNGVACVVTALGALTPSLPTLDRDAGAGARAAHRGRGDRRIISAEEMPAGARAYAVGLLTMAGAGGGGLAVLLLPLADTGAGGWRILFAIALLGLLPLAHLRKYLPESRRFRVPHAESEHGRPRSPAVVARHLGATARRVLHAGELVRQRVPP